jgi:hypothetical protein
MFAKTCFAVVTLVGLAVTVAYAGGPSPCGPGVDCGVSDCARADCSSDCHTAGCSSDCASGGCNTNQVAVPDDQDAAELTPA